MAYTAIPSTGGAPAAGSITSAMLRDSAGLSVIGRSANSTGVPADIVGTADQVLRVSGTTLGFGGVTGTMMSGFTNTQIAYGNSSGQLVNSAGFTANTTTGSLQWSINVTTTSFNVNNIGSATMARLLTSAANTSTRSIAVDAYGPTAAGNFAGINKTSMVAITDSTSATAPSAMLVHTQGATDLVFAVANTEAARFDNATRRLKFASGSITATGTGTVTNAASNGPGSGSISVQEWLTVQNASGTTCYIPMYR